MEARENGQKMNTSSFTFDHVDDNIELIDISAEDDGFLISSPLFDSLEDLRLSVTIDDRNEDDGYQFSEGENCQSTMEACRPSLAWDTAFFNSTGFLDPDELSFINKEFDTISARILPLIQDVHARRTDLESRLNAFKNVDVASKNRPKEISLKKSSNIERSRKTKNKRTAKSGEAEICFCKPSKVTSSGKKDILIKQRKRDSLGRSAATTGSGLGLITTKKDAWQSSSCLNSSCLSSPKFSSSVSMTPTKASSISGASVRASNPRVSSSLFSKNTESKKSKLRLSHSTSKILRYSEKSKRLGNTNLSTRSFSALDHSSCTSPARFSNHSSSVSLSSSLSSNQKSKVSTTKLCCTSQHNNAKVAPDLQNNPDSNLSHSLESREMRSPVEFSSHALARFHRADSESLETVQASGLRMPSPKIGYFDESTSPSSTGTTKRKATQKILSETVKTKLYSLGTELSNISLGHTASYKKPKNPCSERSRTIASSKTAPKFPTNHLTYKNICSKLRKTNAGKCHTHKVGKNCRLEKDRDTKGLFKNEKSKESKGSNYDTCVRLKGSNSIKNVTEDGSRIGDLSIYFEAIDLNRDKVMPLKKYDHNKVETRDEKDRVCDQQLYWPKISLKPCTISPSTIDFKARTRTPLTETTSLQQKQSI